MELELTWGRTVRLWWGLVWRNLVMSLAAGVGGGILGGIIGFAAGFAGLRADQLVFITVPLGIIIGLAASVVAVRWLLRRRIGDFRLVLVPVASALGGVSSAGPVQPGAMAPGWYPDPSSPGVQRWWDGARWTEHTQGPVA